MLDDPRVQVTMNEIFPKTTHRSIAYENIAPRKPYAFTRRSLALTREEALENETARDYVVPASEALKDQAVARASERAGGQRSFFDVPASSSSSSSNMAADERALAPLSVAGDDSSSDDDSDVHKRRRRRRDDDSDDDSDNNAELYDADGRLAL